MFRVSGIPLLVSAKGDIIFARPHGGIQGVQGAGRPGGRPLRKCILRCVGEGLCPSRGRPQGSPLRRVTSSTGGGPMWGANRAPPVADAARRFRGSAPIGGHNSGRESAGTTVGKRTPPLRRVTRGAVGGPMWASAPTGGTRGAMGGRPQGSPLRSVTRSAVGRVVREADPYGGVTRRAAQIKGGPAGRPYGFYIHFLYLTSTFYMRFAENQSPRGRGFPV